MAVSDKALKQMAKTPSSVNIQAAARELLAARPVVRATKRWLRDPHSDVPIRQALDAYDKARKG